MGRLTEGSACFMFCAGEREELGEDCSFYEVCFERQMYDKLKHYEDLEEAGRLIDVIRCKDCIHERYCKQAQYLGEDGYCSKAELKELEGDKE